MIDYLSVDGTDTNFYCCSPYILGWYHQGEFLFDHILSRQYSYCDKLCLLLFKISGIARVFQKGGVTLCESWGTHQIVMSFLPPAVCCKRGASRAPQDPSSYAPLFSKTFSPLGLCSVSIKDQCRSSLPACRLPSFDHLVLRRWQDVYKLFLRS